MNPLQDPEEIATVPSVSPTPKISKNLKRFGVAVACLTLLFIKPLYDLVRFALSSSFFSYIPLIPFISLYLMREQKGTPHGKPETSPRTALVFFFASLAAFAIYWFGLKASDGNYLTATILAFVLLVWGAYLFLVGKSLFTNAAFPIVFLVFMVPFPTFLTNAVEIFFQHSSAAAAAALLHLSNASYFREDLIIRLPGITLEVAPECSGIRSTLVLLITSLLAGHLFLQSPWKKAILALFIIPLAIVRNGFRIFVIAQLCLHGGPDMVDSFLHRRGGPIFFALSLIPFFGLLLVLRTKKLKTDRCN